MKGTDMTTGHDSLSSSGLDESQLRFCREPGKSVRLLAPAGSGKTLSLLWRCLHAWEANPEHNQRFLVFTFTRMACQELQDRLRTRPQFAPIRDAVEISTLNSWGFRRLKQKTFSARLCTSDADRYFCVKNLLQPIWRAHSSIETLIQNQPVRGPKAVMALMDSLKSFGFRHDLHTDYDGMVKHAQWLQFSGLSAHLDTMLADLKDLDVLDGSSGGDSLLHEFHDDVFSFWRDACNQLSESAMFTLEDQKYWPLLLLDTQLGEGKYTTGIQRIHHILVDEFQDINVLDLNLLKTIARLNKTSLTIVGDDDQAIYEWRGATPRFIVHPDTYVRKGYETCTLEVNYRSPRNIVAISQTLIKHNKNRVDKNVRAVSQQDADIRVLSSKTLNDTVEYVCRLVKELLTDPEFARIAIIARKRSQIIPYQIVFAADDTPFYAAEDLNVLLSNAFKELREILITRTRANVSGRPAYETTADLLQLCDKVKRFPLAKKDKELLRSHLARQQPHSLIEAVSALMDYTGPLKGQNTDGCRSLAFAEPIMEFLASDTVSDALNSISANFSGLQKDYGKSADDIFYADPPFLYLAEYASRYGRDYPAFIDDVEKAIATLAVKSPDDDVEEPVKEKPYKRPLHLMTAYRAKGKEYDAVIMLDVNDGIWPVKMAETAAQKEQERRIFYVGMTRARKLLTFIVNESILEKKALPSPYLAECGLLDNMRRI